MVWLWSFFGVCWGFFVLTTYFALTENEHLPFFLLIAAIFLLLGGLHYPKKKRGIASIPEGRLSQFYDAFKQLYREEEKRLHTFWWWAFGGVCLGWTLFLWGHLFNQEALTHPAAVVGYFFLALFMGAKGIEKGRQVDAALHKVVLKGSRVEVKLKARGAKNCSYFSKRQRIFPYLWRIFPFVLIIFPLFKWGLSPLLFERATQFHESYPSFFEAVPMVCGCLLVAYWILSPFFEMRRNVEK